jgi:Flagellar hook-length control protein
LPTLSTLPAHAAAHYAARPADDGAARLPAAQLANPLVRVVENGGGEFRIDLMPDDLGPVRVVAEVHGGRVALNIQAEHADTLSLLRRDIHHLERALSDAGFELDGGTLQFSLRGDDQPRGFASFGQGLGGQGSGDQGTGGNRAVWREDAAQAAPLPERAAVPVDGLVDITV